MSSTLSVAHRMIATTTTNATSSHLPPAQDFRPRNDPPTNPTADKGTAKEKATLQIIRVRPMMMMIFFLAKPGLYQARDYLAWPFTPKRKYFLWFQFSWGIPHDMMITLTFEKLRFEIFSSSGGGRTILKIQIILLSYSHKSNLSQIFFAIP